MLFSLYNSGLSGLNSGAKIMTDSRWSRLLTSVLVLVGLQIPFAMGTQHPTNRNGTVPLQPFADQIREIETTLDFLGQPLAKQDQQSINEALGSSDPSSAVSRI